MMTLVVLQWLSEKWDQFRHRRHARRRRLDAVVIQAILDSLKSGRWYGRTDLGYQAWQMFIEQPGQEHWLCACADEARVDVERRILIFQ